MTITRSDAAGMYKEYQEEDIRSANYTIELPDGLNEPDPLFLLERVNDHNSFTSKVEIVAVMVKGKQVNILCGKEKVSNFVFNQGSLGALFIGKAYLLQILIDYVYAVAVKKLTPPSVSSSAEVAASETK